MKTYYVNLIIGIFCFLASAHTFGANPQTDRFNRWLNVLEPLMSSGRNGMETAPKLIAATDSRIAAFNLQALGRIYVDKDKHKEFKELVTDFKDIEDKIGSVDKWIKINNKTETNKAMMELARLLDMKGWTKDRKSPRIHQIRKFLNDIKWPKESQDQNVFSDHLLKELKNISVTEYNFQSLEVGNGLHEFRRDLRWFLIKARVLNGGIEFRPDKMCPIPAYVALLNDPIATSKYSGLDQDITRRYNCKISRCLFLAVVKTVEEIGIIKDELEKIHGATGKDDVPLNFKMKAEAIYADLKKNQAVPALIHELRQCQK